MLASLFTEVTFLPTHLQGSPLHWNYFHHTPLYGSFDYNSLRGNINTCVLVTKRAIRRVVS
jgi:hypothetical protein